MGAIIVIFCGWIVFMAFDARRFGWSHTPWWAQALGVALIVGAFYGWVGVLKANSFASVTLRVQEERGQTVISTALRRRAASDVRLCLLLFIGTPLLLGSLWGLWAWCCSYHYWRLACSARRRCSWTDCPVIANTPPRSGSAYCPVSGDKPRCRIGSDRQDVPSVMWLT